MVSGVGGELREGEKGFSGEEVGGGGGGGCGGGNGVEENTGSH